MWKQSIIYSFETKDTHRLFKTLQSYRKFKWVKRNKVFAAAVCLRIICQLLPTFGTGLGCKWDWQYKIPMKRSKPNTILYLYSPPLKGKVFDRAQCKSTHTLAHITRANRNSLEVISCNGPGRNSSLILKEGEELSLCKLKAFNLLGVRSGKALSIEQ